MQIEPFSSLLYLTFFIVGLLLLFLKEMGIVHLSRLRWLKSAQIAEWDLSSFMKLVRNRPKSSKAFLFTEESIHSMAYRFLGRFDAAVLRWDESPILEVMIERKFPAKYLPNKAREEDVFQASLYALALRECGMSCSSTKIVTIYCLQHEAKRCIQSNDAKSCINCDRGRVYVNKFNTRETTKAIERLDQIWFRDRKPIASPEKEKCIRCPYSKNGQCNYSAI